MDGPLQEELKQIKNQIDQELSLNPLLERPNIIAVSKKQPVDKIKVLYGLGLNHFAENYLQEALLKQEQLKQLAIYWHYIGRIQSKKIKNIVGAFDLIHTVSRISEIEKISLVAEQKKIKQKFLVQINIAGEETKQGFTEQEVRASIKAINQFSHTKLCGMMVFPPIESSEEATARWFQKSQALFQGLQNQVGEHFQQLSMGTSGDFPLATRFGATDLRIGESLMGTRTEP